MVNLDLPRKFDKVILLKKQSILIDVIELKKCLLDSSHANSFGNYYRLILHKLDKYQNS